jgi:XTP/dITP diphosphohydrolase
MPRQFPRRFKEDRLVLATHNAGKLAEFNDLMKPLGVSVQSSAELDLPEPIEDGLTFEANAILKAESAMTLTGLPCLADDSGLEVFGLDGEPGIYSARWAGPDRDFSLAMTRVRNELIQRFGSFEQADKRARFVAVLCLIWPDGHREIVEGEVLGELVDPPRGQGGFGYDPMFQPDGQDQTFGEMPAEAKRQLSHRARATDRLLAQCFGVG